MGLSLLNDTTVCRGMDPGGIIRGGWSASTNQGASAALACKSSKKTQKGRRRRTMHGGGIAHSNLRVPSSDTKGPAAPTQGSTHLQSQGLSSCGKKLG